MVICPDLYERFGHGTPDDVTAKARGEGGVADDSVVGDCEAAREYLKALPNCNGKVGIAGTCSGGRHAFLVACRAPGFNAVVDLWGGNVVMPADRLTDKQPVAPIDYTKDLSCPVLGLFGNDDQSPSPEQVDQLEAELKKQARPTSSTGTMEPDTASGTSIARLIDTSRRWTHGPRRSLSLANIWPRYHQVIKERRYVHDDR